VEGSCISPVELQFYHLHGGTNESHGSLIGPFDFLAEITLGHFLNTNQRDFFRVELLGLIVLSFLANIVIIRIWKNAAKSPINIL
jgi:hypothetical protein